MDFDCIAFVVIRDKAETTDVKTEILKLCKKELPRVFVPTKIYIIDEISLTRAGKIDYRYLEKETEKLSEI